MSTLEIKHLSKDATTPTRGSSDAVGYDLYAAESCTIDTQDNGLVKTHIAICMPPGVYGRVAPRSGLALKKHIDVGAGVIDPDYRGDVGVVLFNHGHAPFEVKKGDRIAQLILERCVVADQVKVVKTLSETKRGADGYGSTGVSSTLKEDVSQKKRKR